MSPLLPRLDKNETKNFEEKAENENFKSDLLNYISSYNLSQLEKIKEEIENFDFSQVKIRLVASIPGKGIFKLHFPRIATWYRPRDIAHVVAPAVHGMTPSASCDGHEKTYW